MGKDRQGAIEEQIKALLEAEFIKESQDVTWLANVVMVKMSNGKWRMYTDYTNLNKACPKDPYPLRATKSLCTQTMKRKQLSSLT